MRFRLWRRHPLPDPVPPVRDYWVSARVDLHQPILADEEDPDPLPPMIGYYRNFGIRCAPLSLRRIVEEAVREDGLVRWDDTEWERVDPATLHRDIRRRIVVPEGEGIWVTTGKAFFPEDP
jgi:hypothetical protein